MPCTLEEARVRKGVSKEAIIRESGLSKQTVYTALGGKKPVSLETTLLIAAAIGVPASEISDEAAALVAKLAS